MITATDVSKPSLPAIFFVTVTARVRFLYVFVVLDVCRRQLVRWN